MRALPGSRPSALISARLEWPLSLACPVAFDECAAEWLHGRDDACWSSHPPSLPSFNSINGQVLVQLKELTICSGVIIIITELAHSLPDHFRLGMLHFDPYWLHSFAACSNQTRDTPINGRTGVINSMFPDGRHGPHQARLLAPCLDGSARPRWATRLDRCGCWSRVASDPSKHVIKQLINQWPCQASDGPIDHNYGRNRSNCAIRRLVIAVRTLAFNCARAPSLSSALIINFNLVCLHSLVCLLF